MKICADGYMKIAVPKRVRTPGNHDDHVEPAPARDALAFLLSHTFPGHRKLARGLREKEQRLLTRALWAESVNERMVLVDRVWRSITEPALPPRGDEPELLQVVQWDGQWAYPLYLEAGTTRVIPVGGVPVPELNGNGNAPRLELR